MIKIINNLFTFYRFYDTHGRERYTKFNLTKQQLKFLIETINSIIMYTIFEVSSPNA
jgi:hypothetical protein